MQRSSRSRLFTAILIGFLCAPVVFCLWFVVWIIIYVYVFGMPGFSFSVFGETNPPPPVSPFIEFMTQLTFYVTIAAALLAETGIVVAVFNRVGKPRQKRTELGS
jgi:hypothetical protein